MTYSDWSPHLIAARKALATAEAAAALGDWRNALLATFAAQNAVSEMAMEFELKFRPNLAIDNLGGQG